MCRRSLVRRPTFSRAARTVFIFSTLALLVVLAPPTDASGPRGGFELKGVIESLPAGGLVGDWVVSGVTVHVSAETMINQEHGAAAVGAKVEVKGTQEADGSITACCIKVEETEGDGDSGLGHAASVSFAVLALEPGPAAPPEAEGVAITRLLVLLDGTVHEDLAVAVEHLAPGAVYDVIVDGFNAGPVLTNEEGEGRLFLSTRNTPSAEPLPSELRPLADRLQVDVVDAADGVVLTGLFANARRHNRTNPHGDFIAVAWIRTGGGETLGHLTATVRGEKQKLGLDLDSVAPSANFSVEIDTNLLAELVSSSEGELEAEWETPLGDGDALLLPASFTPVSGLLHVRLLDGDGNEVGAGDFLAMPSPSSGVRSRLHH